jgi:type II secretory pathway pseudopilin PulG
MIAFTIALPQSDRHMPEQKRRSGFSWIEVLVVTVVVALLIALLWPATPNVASTPRRSICKNNLKQIGLALHNYVETYGALPPAYTVDANGKPLHSWRTLILPFVEQAPLYAKIDLSKPWDDPVNVEAAQAMPHSVYKCPSVDVPPGYTTYLAVTGPGSCFQPGQPRPFSEITDGQSNTLLVIEVSKPHAVHWMCPQDADVALILSLGKAAKELPHTGGMHGLFGDGMVRFLSATLQVDVLRGLCTVSGNETLGEF